MKWLMFMLNLLPSTVFASATIQEQIAASNNTIMVATKTANVGIATNTPSSGVSLDVAGAAQFGQGVSKSTFNASVSGTVYALQTSSGIKVGGGGPVQFQDGTLQYTANGGGPTLGGNNAWTGNETHAGFETFNSSIIVNGRINTVEQFIAGSSITANGAVSYSVTPMTSSTSYHIHFWFTQGGRDDKWDLRFNSDSAAGNHKWANRGLTSTGATGPLGSASDSACTMTTDAVLQGDGGSGDIYIMSMPGNKNLIYSYGTVTYFTSTSLVEISDFTCRYSNGPVTSILILTDSGLGTFYSGGAWLKQDLVQAGN